jgi:co-chaperonin GroES (HSP10)
MKIRAIGDNVVLKPRLDLFSETDRDTGIELVSNANSVTSVPDNMACCEVVSVGPLVTAVKAGDLAFIDFFRVKQGYIVADDECYICGGDAFCGLYRESDQTIQPLDNFVVTRAAPERYKVALTGTDRIDLLRMQYTDGFASGHTSKGTAAAHTLYHEVVSIGRLTNRPRPDSMTPVERRFLDLLVTEPASLYHGDQDAEEALAALLKERNAGRQSDIEVGQLVGFCKEIGQKVRVRGEYQWLVPYESVLAEIDDAAILREAILAGRAGKIQLA